MTIQSENSKVVYTADGITDEFPVPFYFFAGQIAVYKNSDDTPLEQGTDYTVSNQENYNGGTITLTTVPAAGDTITITRNVELKQLITFLEGENFPAVDFEHALDKLTMGLQQMHECMERAVVVPHGTELKSEDIFHCLEMLNQYWEIVITLPEYVSSILNSTTEEVEEDNHHLVTSAGVYNYAYDRASVNEKIDTLVRKIADTEIAISSSTATFSADSSDYPYAYHIAIEGVDENTCPVVMFSQTDALGGNFAPFAKAEDDGIIIYVRDNSSYTTTIPLILLL